MKKVLSTTVFLFTLVLSFAQPAAKIIVIVKAGQFTMQKINITNGWKFAPVGKALGTINDRKRPGFNTTHTYDDFGIVLFEKNKSDKVGTGILSEVQFYFAPMDTTTVSPKGLFTGKMQIEKLKISSSLTWADVKESLKDFELTDSYMEHNFRLAYKGLYFYFLFNDEETTLRKISIGKDMRDKK